MDINISNAVNKFYPNPSLEMVYFEAIANAIDANATKIDIGISLDAFNAPETLEIKVTDNGTGFTDENFKKFGTLLEHQDKYHKGLGRLVYLQYFKTVDIKSHFDKKTRTFKFDKKFKKKSTVVKQESNLSGATLHFKQYYKKNIKTYSYVTPKDLVESVRLRFYPILYNRKSSNKQLEINFNLTVKQQSSKLKNTRKSLIASNLPELKEMKFDDKLDLFSDVILSYQINKNYKGTSIITAISVDGRTINLDLLSEDEIPQGYEVFVLFTSKYFDGKASNNREAIDIDKPTLDKIKRIFRKNIKKLFEHEIPEISKRNDKIVAKLQRQYPYLNGYVTKDLVGLAKRDSLLDEAHRRFFEDQKKILESENLTDEQYEKALKLSSRILTEYIIYRQKIIDKLKVVDMTSTEAEIHNLIVPTKEVLDGEKFIEDIYRNNIWLLDDKFMTYSTILSEKEMKRLLEYIKLDDEFDDDTRPDIAIVFSKDPSETKRLVDVVIVELKKMGLKLAKKEEVVSQLRQRARKLLQFYPNQIGRIWFYGIVDIDKEFRISLKENGFTPVYSEDQVFYNEQKIIVDEDKNIVVPIGLNIMSYKALMMDADARNSTFLKILIDSIESFNKDMPNNNSEEIADNDSKDIQGNVREDLPSNAYGASTN